MIKENPIFLFGNGLSIALSPEFALRTITEKFIYSLDGEEKEFLEGISTPEGVLSFDDFERNFSMLEAALASLTRYRRFLDSEVGDKFLIRFALDKPGLVEHERIIKGIYNKYVARILDLIRGNVRKDLIEEKLAAFTRFFSETLNNSSKGYVFTLNYDLLVETILLETLGTNNFMDFCYPASSCQHFGFPKFDFNPRRSLEIFPEASKVELHHLHGSLSLFYDVARNRAFKYKSEDIGLGDIYRKISQEDLPILPAIITGGGKSEKIVEYPFDWYYRSLKDLVDAGAGSSLYIIGYSFRDEHINDLVKRWMKSVQDFSKGLLIVDYKPTLESQEQFVRFVTKSLQKRKIPEQCFVFGGVNQIHAVEGTKTKS